MLNLRVEVGSKLLDFNTVVELRRIASGIVRAGTHRFCVHAHMFTDVCVCVCVCTMYVCVWMDGWVRVSFVVADLIGGDKVTTSLCAT